MFEEYEVVRLKKDMPSENLKAGTRGTVLIVYPDSPPAYEVEFLDENGNSLTVLTLEEEAIEKIKVKVV